MTPGDRSFAARLAGALPFSASARRRRAASCEPPLAAAAAGLPLPPGTHVGQAQVVAVEADGRPRVRLSAGAAEVVATWAIPYRYEPAVGDLLTVIGREGAFYVLGVAHGAGRSRLWFVGDASLRAGRTLRLRADRGIRAVGRRLTQRAERLELEARELHAHSETAATRIKGLSQLVAGGVRRITAGPEGVVARAVRVLGRDTVKLDGEHIKIN